MSFSQDEIAWQDHCAWYRRRLNDSETEMYVAELRGLPVGQVRLQLTEGEVSLSYSLDALVRGRGLGHVMVDRAMQRRVQWRDREVVARVRVDNVPSNRIFRRLGWSEIRESDDSTMFRSRSL
jgi:RimJ/RimL family protein N-acetyltransferase